MPSRIRIKLGGIEVEYEGEHDFLEQDLLGLIKDLMAVAPQLQPSRSDAPTRGDEVDKAGEKPPATGTVSTFAAKLKVTSGADLIIAALFQARTVDELVSLKRRELLSRMKSATAYYKSTYSANLSSYLKTLVKAGDINEVSAEEYAISPSKMTDLESRLVVGT